MGEESGARYCPHWFMKIYECSYCAYQSSKPFNVGRHMKRKHQDMTGEITQFAKNIMENSHETQISYPSEHHGAQPTPSFQ